MTCPICEKDPCECVKCREWPDDLVLLHQWACVAVSSAHCDRIAQPLANLIRDLQAENERLKACVVTFEGKIRQLNDRIAALEKEIAEANTEYEDIVCEIPAGTLYDKAAHRVRHMAKRIAGLEAENERLRAIVDKLPKTADGGMLYPVAHAAAEAAREEEKK